MNAHEDLDTRLSEYLDGELSAEEREAVERLLAQSPEARVELEALRRASNWVRELPRESAPPNLLNKVSAGIRSESVASGRAVEAGAEFARAHRPKPWSRGMLSFAALVCVAVLLFALVGPQMRNQPVPQPDAAAKVNAPSASAPEGSRERLDRLEAAAEAVPLDDAPAEPTAPRVWAPKDAGPPAKEFLDLDPLRQQENGTLKLKQEEGGGNQAGAARDTTTLAIGKGESADAGDLAREPMAAPKPQGPAEYKSGASKVLEIEGHAPEAQAKSLPAPSAPAAEAPAPEPRSQEAQPVRRPRSVPAGGEVEVARTNQDAQPPGQAQTEGEVKTFVADKPKADSETKQEAELLDQAAASMVLRASPQEWAAVTREVMALAREHGGRLDASGPGRAESPPRRLVPSEASAPEEPGRPATETGEGSRLDPATKSTEGSGGSRPPAHLVLKVRVPKARQSALMKDLEKRVQNGRWSISAGAKADVAGVAEDAQVEASAPAKPAPAQEVAENDEVRTPIEWVEVVIELRDGTR
ncbi:MAG: hypothetical protein HS116_19745 [Planctomycetes bacterium]|nr:hypothetical protein [Planctomycetota bacterium]